MLRIAVVAAICMMAACTVDAELQRFGATERVLAGYGGYYGGAAISEDVPQISEDMPPPQPSSTSTASTASNIFSSTETAVKGSVPSGAGAVVGLVVGLVGVTAVVAYVAVHAIKKVFAARPTDSMLTSALT